MQGFQQFADKQPANPKAARQANEHLLQLTARASLIGGASALAAIVAIITLLR